MPSSHCWKQRNSAWAGRDKCGGEITVRAWKRRSAFLAVAHSQPESCIMVPHSHHTPLPDVSSSAKLPCSVTELYVRPMYPMYGLPSRVQAAHSQSADCSTRAPTVFHRHFSFFFIMKPPDINLRKYNFWVHVSVPAQWVHAGWSLV